MLTIILIELFVLVLLIMLFFVARNVCLPHFRPHHWKIESKSYVQTHIFGIMTERSNTLILDENDSKNACEYTLICRQCGKEKTQIMPCKWHPEDENWD